ncbi:MAG TPA: hypothetical protein VE978_22915 [Chitinophagales bacterium]|nr:hypothetical protein [Chitinophagales bacterium]
MKTLSFTLLLFLFSLVVSAQTKILDSKLISDKLILYCSDSLAVQVAVTISTTNYQSANVLNASYTIGSDLTFVDNNLTIPLTPLSSNDYFVTITIIRPDNSNQQMQFETSL